MTVTVETVSLTQAGLELVILEHEYYQNIPTIRRLLADREAIDNRLAALRNRQRYINQIIDCVIQDAGNRNETYRV